MMARRATTNAAAGHERVAPQLRDLVSLAPVSTALPPWSRSIRARQSGGYLSSFRGRGMEYDESRPYQPGDDIRQLDWRVTARTGKPHTKLFREERERPVFLCVDYRRAMFFGTRGVFKAVQAARVTSLLAWRAQQNGDRVGGLVFSEAAHDELPPRRGKTAAMQWIKLLVAAAAAPRHEPAAASGHGVNDALARLARVAKPGSLIFVVSDFRHYDDDTAAAIARLATHNDVALIIIYDPLEAEFPEIHEAAAIAEGERTVRLAGISGEQRAAYGARFRQRLDALRQLGRERRLLLATIDTQADPAAALIRLFNG